MASGPDTRHVAGVSLVIERETVATVRAFRERGIRAVVLKGPLQQRWLASAGPPRSSSDVDLLVAPDALASAESALHALGYTQLTDNILEIDHAQVWHAPGRVGIDLHWTLWGADPEKAWVALAGALETAHLDGETVEVPNEPARCFIVAVHAGNHGGDFIGPLYDLERALEVAKPAVWREALELARRAEALPSFVSGLLLVERGRELCAELGLQRQPLSDREALNLASAPSGAAGIYWFARQPTLGAKLRFARRRMFPPTDAMRFQYPIARRSRAGLAVAYLVRQAALVRWALPGFRYWLALRRQRTSARAD